MTENILTTTEDNILFSFSVIIQNILRLYLNVLI